MSLHRTLRGQDLHSPSSELIENNSGSTIPILTAVKFNGMGTVYPQIVVADGATDIIRGVTQAWTVGTILYASSVGALTSAPSGLPLASVLAQDTVNGIIYVNNLGVTKGDLDALQFPDALSLELAWSANYPSFYSEPTYDINGKLTASDIWDSAAKVIHIFHKAYTYVGANVTKVVVTRVYDGQKIEKDLTYDINGRLLTVTRTYTP